MRTRSASKVRQSIYIFDAYLDPPALIEAVTRVVFVPFEPVPTACARSNVCSAPEPRAENLCAQALCEHKLH